MERRGDIQGLRAMSALLVAAFHLWFSGVSGGVDVFFVVAGYFMAQSAFRRIDAEGRLRVVPVWRQLALRIFPNLIVCLIGILAMVLLLFEGPVRADALRHVIASALYLENYYLVWRALDPAGWPSMQQITEPLWALGLIGQAYLLLPPLLALVAWRSRGRPGRIRRRARQTLAAIAIASFAYGLAAMAYNSEAAYYALLPRLWQFALGALLALTFVPQPSRAVAAAGSWLAVALLVSCGFVLSFNHFPGLASLWPATAAMLILTLGRQSDPLNAGWLLSRAPLRRLGDHAYGFYIWHWPLAFPLLVANDWRPLSWTAGAAVIAAAFAMAAAVDAGTRRIMAVPAIAARPAAASVALVAMLLLIAAASALVLTAS